MKVRDFRTVLLSIFPQIGLIFCGPEGDLRQYGLRLELSVREGEAGDGRLQSVLSGTGSGYSGVLSCISLPEKIHRLGVFHKKL